MRVPVVGMWMLFATLPAAAVTLPQEPVLPRYEIVEALGTTDFFASLAIDPLTQRPLVAYIDTSGLDAANARVAPVKLRGDDGWVWRSDTLGTLSMTGSAGETLRDLRLVADTFGRRHVLAIEPNTSATGDNGVVYLRRDGNGDSREVLATGTLRSVTLAVSSDNRVYAAWIRDHGLNGGTLVVRTRGADGLWLDIDTSALPGGSFLPAFAPTPIDPSSGLVHLVWGEAQGGTQQVRHATLDGTFASVRQVAHFSTAVAVQQLFASAAADGRLEVAVARVVTSTQHVMERRVLAAGATAWSCAPAGCTYPLPTLAAQYSGRALALGPEGRRALSFNDIDFRTGLAFEDPARGQAWHVENVAPIARVQDVAYDRFGNLHAVGVDQGNHRDIMLLRLRAPWSSSGLDVAGAGLASMPSSVAFTRDEHGAPLVYARNGVQDGSGAVHAFVDGVLVAHPLPAGFTVASADAAVAADGTWHVAFRDAAGGQVWHAQRAPTVGSSWTVTQVSSNPVPAFDPRLVIGPRGAPRVLYRQADVLAVAGKRPTGVWLTRELGSPATALSRPRLAGTSEAQVLYASWFDSVEQALRVTAVVGDIADPAATVTLIDRSPPTPQGWVFGSTAHDIAFADDGFVALAHSQSAEGLIGLGYSRFDGARGWVGIGSEPAPFTAVPITRIVLDTAFTLSSAPRIAWISGTTTVTQRLHYAEKRFSDFTWSVTDLGLYPVATPTLALTTRGGVRIAYAEGAALRVARRLEALDLGSVGGTFPMVPEEASLIALCVTTLRALANGPHVIGREHAASAGGATSTGDDVISRVRERFRTTPAGRYYLLLFEEHREELMDLTLASPDRFIERMRTLADLMPGLSALADGDGSAYRLNAPILASARGVWHDWALWGSPALATAVHAELARTDDLAAFGNLDFEQWFAALRVGTATDRIHVDGFE